MSSLIRSRWAAIGAAVAVTLGGGGVMFVDAAKDSGDRPVTVMLDEPCRIRDTRPDKAIGGRTTPLGEAEALEVTTQANAGDCATKIPADAVGLITNVTAVGASLNTNLRLYPKGATMPETSNLNPRGGGDPVTNAVTVGLDSSGVFIIRNNKGTVHVIIDVAGYLVHHTHGEYDNAEGAFKSINSTSNSVNTTEEVVATATVDTPTSGYVLATAVVQGSAGANQLVQCSLSLNGAHNLANFMVADVDAGDQTVLPVTKMFVENKALVLFPDDNEMAVNLVCNTNTGTFNLNDIELALVFIPDPDAFGYIVIGP